MTTDEKKKALTSADSGNQADARSAKAKHVERRHEEEAEKKRCARIAILVKHIEAQREDLPKIFEEIDSLIAPWDEGEIYDRARELIETRKAPSPQNLAQRHLENQSPS